MPMALARARREHLDLPLVELNGDAVAGGRFGKQILPHVVALFQRRVAHRHVARHQLEVGQHAVAHARAPAPA
jgi:hypothetical protein